ncbi:hypothetical protein [Halostreptopolyspora alba]|uniref:ParB/Sulfiredoxin domain-containing protein n=1 Tax=Halostreptopolyspora alba TaxID=2487137 RepID=A0A3N0E692_9ACTN|nr:hypothetical protein EFW17_16675 [Nocardiopsaceae bacterium YIM 96095]
MKTTVMLVTPAQAHEWLEKNSNNRPLNRTTIEQFTKQIARGEWQLTHQAIAFDEEGELLDGQHRLHAIIRADTPVQAMVVEGAPRASFTVLDTGRKRTGKDVLHLAGEENTVHLASALRGLYLYQVAPDASWSGSSSMVSNDQLVEILEKNPGMRHALTKATAIHRSVRITVTAAAIGWYVTSQARPDIDQSPWFDGLTTGAELKHGDPRLTLRNTMMSLSSGKRLRKREDSREHLFYYIKAWNAWAEGKQQKILRRSPNERMPVPTTRQGKTTSRAEGNIFSVE